MIDFVVSSLVRVWTHNLIQLSASSKMIAEWDFLCLMRFLA